MLQFRAWNTLIVSVVHGWPLLVLGLSTFGSLWRLLARQVCAALTLLELSGQVRRSDVGFDPV